MPTSLEIRAPLTGRRQEVLNPVALGLVDLLQRRLGQERSRLLTARAERQLAFDAGELPDFQATSAEVRRGSWRVPPAPPDLADRRVEITGPTDAKMVINALNSGARVFMADLEDANTPTWANMVDGQVNLADAVRRRIVHEAPDGRRYQLSEDPAVLMVRPRGWHLSERHVALNGEPVSASLFDAAVYLANNAEELLERGSGPYLYLPKLESHAEAGLWHDAFDIAEEYLSLPSGAIRATVLVETIPAAFEMDEILHALGNHATGLNAGRWDYMFSLIKKFREDPTFVLPDRAEVKMTVPFMRSYTELLVRTCHRRGAHAMGGMAAFVPSRRDEEVNRRAFEQVRADKERESADGFDGTWVAHPDLVVVAREVFDSALRDRPNQIERQRDDVAVEARDLLDVTVPGAEVTEAGVRNNIAVGLRYLESWLRGRGAVTIFNLMEDAATAEIARSQLWQWSRHGVGLAGGGAVTGDLVHRIQQEEMGALAKELAGAGLGGGRLNEAAELFEEVALAKKMPDFLTLLAYELID